MKKEKDSILLTPINMSLHVPVYNARGRICGYDIGMRYYIGKMFMYSPLSDKKTEINNAMQWVCGMQESGYELVKGSLKVYDAPQTGCIEVYMLCDYIYRFRNFPFFNARVRARRFWLKNQGEVSRNQRDKELMRRIYENTK